MDMNACYTEEPVAHRELTRFNPRYDTYEERGRVFAWQHLVRPSAWVYLNSRFAGNETLINKELQASRLKNLPRGRRSPIKPRFDMDPLSSKPQRGPHEMTEEVK